MHSLAVEVDGLADLQFPTGRWLADADAVDEAVLDLALAPVIDVGCGPGRHVHALARRGVPAMGVDITPAVVRLARHRGLPVLERSVFDHLPGLGRWGTALLLDGNIGIGADPAGLLARVAALLRPGGRVLVEVEGPGGAGATAVVRLASERGVGPWFGWTRMGIDRVGAVCPAGLAVHGEPWALGSRWFVRLDRCP